MSIAKEFKTFAMKGNVVDLAVGVIIGAAFGKIVTALVEQILMPPIGLAVGGVDFSQLRIVIKEAAGNQPEVALGYGVFIQALVNFLIVAFALFMVIRAMNKLNKQPQPPPAVTPEDIVLLREIRDSLRK